MDRLLKFSLDDAAIQKKILIACHLSKKLACINFFDIKYIKITPLVAIFDLTILVNFMVPCLLDTLSVLKAMTLNFGFAI